MGPQLDHLGYTGPVYSDLYEFACAFYRPFEQHSRNYPNYKDDLTATAAVGNESGPFLRGNPDVIQLKVGTKLRM